MKRGLQGRYETVSTVGETVKAFIPNPLPPFPALEITGELQKKLDEAAFLLGKLDGSANLLPDVGIFLYMFIRKEAVLSSQIEGTQSSLSDLLLFELKEKPGVPIDDVQEVSNYVAAMTYGLKRLEEGFPLSLRLLREIHAELLAKGRGSGKNPGEFRHSQNWIGGTRPGNAFFVPPPPEEAARCMGELEKFLHDENTPEPHARAQPAASRSASDGTPPKSECLAEIAHAAGEFKAVRGNPHIFAGCKNEEQKEKATAGKSYLPKQSLAFCRGLPLEKTAKKMVGVRGFEPPASASRTQRSSQTEPHPDRCIALLPCCFINISHF